MSKNTKTKTYQAPSKTGAGCIHFKPQRTTDKRRGCVQVDRCAQCGKCAYLPPEAPKSEA